MSYIITQVELAHLTETELRGLYHRIVSDLTRRNLSLDDCPLAEITLQNILRVLARKQVLQHKAPRF